MHYTVTVVILILLTKCVSHYFVGKLHYGALIYQPLFQGVIFSIALELHVSCYVSAFGTFTLLKKKTP